MSPACCPQPLIPRRNVSMEEQRRVLMKRRGSVVGRRSILKSYSLPPGGAGAAAGQGGRSPLAVEGVTDIRWGWISLIGDLFRSGLKVLLRGALGGFEPQGPHPRLYVPPTPAPTPTPCPLHPCPIPSQARGGPAGGGAGRRHGGRPAPPAGGGGGQAGGAAPHRADRLARGAGAVSWK